MLSSVRGTLQLLDDSKALAHLEVGAAITFEIHVPPSTLAELRALETGAPCTLHVVLDFLAQGSTGSIKPRLFGFLHELDRQFFLSLLRVGGIGASSALEMMTHPSARIAAAIMEKDKKFLRTLKGVGEKKADLLIVELHQKVAGIAAGDNSVALRNAAAQPPQPVDPVGQAVLGILIGQLDLDARTAADLLERARDASPEATTVEALLQAAFELR